MTSLVPVKVLAASDLVENGGEYKLIGRRVKKVRGHFSAGNRQVVGGSAIPVYIIPNNLIRPDLFIVEGDQDLEALEVIATSDLPEPRDVEGRVAYAIYAVNGWPNPSFLLLETGDYVLLETGDKIILNG